MLMRVFSEPFCRPAVLSSFDHSGTGKDRALCVRLDGAAHLFPMDHVRADGMAPGHVAPLYVEWIVLEEQVILCNHLSEFSSIHGAWVLIHQIMTVFGRTCQLPFCPFRSIDVTAASTGYDTSTVITRSVSGPLPLC